MKLRYGSATVNSPRLAADGTDRDLIEADKSRRGRLNRSQAAGRFVYPDGLPTNLDTDAA